MSSALQKPAGPEVLRDLASSGQMRAAINLGNPVLAQRDPGSNELRGVSVDLARELALRLGVPVELIPFDAAGKVFEALKSESWDLAFLAIDPTRAEQILFTPPYVLIEGTYVVRATSPLMTPEQVDRPGIRVATGEGSAYDLFLTRTLKHARIERRKTGKEAFDLFIGEELDAAAGVRQVLLGFAEGRNDLRVMPQSFMTIEQAMGTPRGREAGLSYLSSFIEEMKRGGFIAKALQKSGQTGASVAPSR